MGNNGPYLFSDILLKLLWFTFLVGNNIFLRNLRCNNFETPICIETLAVKQSGVVPRKWLKSKNKYRFDTIDALLKLQQAL